QTATGWSRRRCVAAWMASLALFAGYGILKALVPINELVFLMALVGPYLPKAIANIVLLLLGFMTMLIGLMWLIALILPPVAASILVALRRRQRDKVLRDAALQSGAGSDKYLELLR